MKEAAECNIRRRQTRRRHAF